MAEKSTMSKTEELRSFVQSTEKRGIELMEIARATGISYSRLRRIVKYGAEPTLDEADQIEQAIQDLVRQKVSDLTALARA